MNLHTKCVHDGTRIDQHTHGLNTPIHTSTSFEYLDSDTRLYPRNFNVPNQLAVVEKLCALEGTEDGIVVGSGMAAISATLMSLLKPGDHAIVQDEIYGGAYFFITGQLKSWGVEVSLVTPEPSALENEIRANTRVIYIETPTNPLLKIVDIKAIAATGRKRGIPTVIDNTFATPVTQNPAALGIDVVVHSGTKYFGGHSDLTCGAVLTTHAYAEMIRKTGLNLGATVNAFTCYQIERSLKTLALRVERQCANAALLASHLEACPDVHHVNYPGLASNPGHAIAASQMRMFGAMISFELAPGLRAHDFMRRLKLVRPAVSLGGIETTICDPASTSHQKLEPQARKRQGITDELLRLSVGIEDCDDLMRDLDQAFAGQ